MDTKKKTPTEQLKDKLISLKTVDKLPRSQNPKEFDVKKFKQLAQKVRGTISYEDLLRLEATL